MELGFVEKVDDPSVLSSSFFPSKVGGKPAWLNLQDLPRPQSVSCKKCRFPLLFLLQVYAPLSDGENDCTFHRSIFLFMCKDPNCHQDDSSKCFRVLRCQLPKVNIFYSLPVSPVLDTSEQLDKLDQEEIEPPSQNDKLISGMTVKDIEGVDDEVKMKPVVSTDAETMSVVCTEVSSLCVVCGMSGPMSCAKCKRVNYCSREHQVYDWRNGHKLFCPELAKGLECVIDYIPSVGAVLPLFEIVTEPEPLPSEVPEEKTIEQRMADYHKIVKTKNLHISEVKHDDFVGEKKSDKQFKAFKKRVALEPEQVIRYDRGNSPLLVSSEGVPSRGDVPNCPCGAERIFEFQVMPQLLYYLKLDEGRDLSVDWGTLLIYTCSKSCSAGPAYKEEFLWRQKISQ